WALCALGERLFPETTQTSTSQKLIGHRLFVRQVCGRSTARARACTERAMSNPAAVEGDMPRANNKSNAAAIDSSSSSQQQQQGDAQARGMPSPFYSNSNANSSNSNANSSNMYGGGGAIMGPQISMMMHPQLQQQ
ncbi:unnamed protein product, partial [Ectocarpus sp. 8 AP-2014]